MDSHAYSVARYKKKWVVADTGGNDLLWVTNRGKISTLAVLPSQPAKITEAFAKAQGVPDICPVVGLTYKFEAVPTDVEVSRDGFMYVATLPGAPEDPSLGARGKVYRVNPHIGHIKLLASGFLGESVGCYCTLGGMRAGWTWTAGGVLDSPGMEYRQLGRCGLRVSTITLGTMGFGGTGWASPVGHIDVEGARKQIGLARDAGVNLFDTADAYSNGLSEEILGEALGSDRDEVLIATKVRNTMGDGPNDAGLSRHHIIRGAEASLRRLGTDYIDLYQVHEWDGQTPLEETLHALDHLVQSGKVRYIGCSNYAAWQLMKALWIADREGVTPFVSMQHYYSLQARDIENELVPLAVDQGLGILVWSPIAGGLLSGKYRRDVGAPPGSRHLTEWSEPPVYDEDKLYDTIEELVAVGVDHGVSAAQVALAYTMGKPAVTSVIVGARTEDQLADNLASADLTLSTEEVDRLDKVSAQPLQYPYWHHLNASDRLSPADLTLLARHIKG